MRLISVFNEYRVDLIGRIDVKPNGCMKNEDFLFLDNYSIEFFETKLVLVQEVVEN